MGWRETGREGGPSESVAFIEGAQRREGRGESRGLRGGAEEATAPVMGADGASVPWASPAPTRAGGDRDAACTGLLSEAEMGEL